MPRLFTGLEVPVEAAETLAYLEGPLTGARWVEEDDLHLTLRFVGDVDYRTADAIADGLAEVRRPAVEVALDRLDAFGGDRPRALIAAAVETEPLRALQTAHEGLMRRLGLPPEPRRFRPHVTLARLKGASSAEVAGFIGAAGRFPPLRFTAHRFALYSARDSVGGGPYVVEATYPLR